MPVPVHASDMPISCIHSGYELKESCHDGRCQLLATMAGLSESQIYTLHPMPLINSSLGSS